MDDKSAGLALILAIGGTLISLAIGYAVFTVAKPSNGYLDNWEKSPHNYGRLWLAYTLGLLFFALTSFAIFQPAGMTISSVLIITPIFVIPAGIVSYLLGYLYGKSKQKINQSVKVSQFVKETNKTLETAIKKTAKQPIKESVKSLQGQTTENNLPNNKTMDEENSEEIDDAEFYLTATKEAEGKDRDEALWAKCMAISEGDEKKAKYGYIKKRVSILIKGSIDKNNEKIALEKKERLKKENDSLTEELQIIRKQEYIKLLKPYPEDKSSNIEQELATENYFPKMINSNRRFILIATFEKNVNQIIKNQ